jgi:hypothetical protein
MSSFLTRALRWGCFPAQKLFVIRMPTRVHERFLIQVHDAIRHQLSSLAGGPAGEFVKDIVFEGSTTYKPVDSEYGRHDPDGSFRHLRERYPGLMTVGAYSQQGKMLQELAEDYILGSDLRVCCLVAFDLSYKGTEATVSIWRPRVQLEAGEEIWSVSAEVHAFRQEDGAPNLDPEAGLKLSLHDFASPKRCREFKNLDQPIFISCKTLYDYIVDAEAPLEAQSSPDSPRPNVRKRRRTVTPDDISSDDERRIIEAEERETKRRDAQDSSFEDTSSGQHISTA